MATKVWPHLKPEDIGKDSFERFVGKQAILGCGFQMSWQKFQATCLKYGEKVDDETCQLTVATFRKVYGKVARLWRDVEAAMRKAILNPGKTFSAGPKLKFTVSVISGVAFLVMKMPSGRSIVYPEPMIEPGGMFGDQVTFYGQVTGKSIWARIGIYGALVVENATQGTAFDIMANGAVQADQAGFEIVALIHDEALALERPGKTLDEFIACLTRLPRWAEGLPIVAEGHVIPFYRK
jgi:DNA polymerase